MRIHFFIAITLLCYLQSNAQGQYFEQALKEGRSRGRTYTMVNTKGKWIGMKNVKKYAESHDLLLGSYKYELVNRFGEPDEKITSIEFLPRYEYPQFIFEQIFPKSSFTSLKTKGKAILPNKLSDESVFALYDNVLWSGEVDINGYISGFGSGFFEDGMLYRYFSGFFVNGQPQGDIDFLDYSHHGSLKFYPKNIVTAMLFSDPNKNDSQLVINSSQNTSSNAYSTSNDSYIKDPVKDLAIVLIGTGLITYGIIKLANAVGFDSNYGVTYSSNRSSYSSKKAKEDGSFDIIPYTK